MHNPEPPVLQANEITELAINMAGAKPLEQEPDPAKTFKFDPSNPAHRRILKRIAKMQRDMAPKHENYKLCRKKCPLFQRLKCFGMECAKQKECWDSMNAFYNDDRIRSYWSDPIRVRLNPACANGCQPNCHMCKHWKTCAVLSHSEMSETVRIEA